MIRYLFVGGLAFLSEYVSFLFLVFIFSGTPLIIAQTVSFGIGFLISFTGSRMFTFKESETNYNHTKKSQLLRYLLLAVVNLIITNILIYLLVEELGILPWVAKIVTMLSVVVWNYIIFSKFIFKKYKLAR